jgi:hypothetical protein
MESVINYQTSYLRDKYNIFSNNLEIGNIFKIEWLGATVEGSINGRKLKFIGKGFINPSIKIIDKKTNQELGSITISNLLSLYPLATLTTNNNIKYKWASQQILDKSWQWLDLETGKTIINANEPFGTLKHNGTITIIDQTSQDDVLIFAGIHLRNVINRKANLIRIMGFIALNIVALIRFW